MYYSIVFSKREWLIRTPLLEYAYSVIMCSDVIQSLDTLVLTRMYNKLFIVILNYIYYIRHTNVWIKYHNIICLAGILTSQENFPVVDLTHSPL